MWLKYNQFKIGLDVQEEQLQSNLAAKLELPAGRIKNLTIKHKSLDARHKNNIFFTYTLLFEIDYTEYELESVLKLHSNLAVVQSVISMPEVDPNSSELAREHARNKIQGSSRPVIVGAGPAGLFAGLKLASAGLRPIIIERGDGLTERITKVNCFWEKRVLDPNSNIQFGIGGAGTFSDGKLMTRVKDPALPQILQWMVKCGGPPEILYWQYPHIGTDLLREVVTKLQEKIIDYGGEIRFRSCLTDFTMTEGRLQSITVNDQTIIETDFMLLAIGNSSRDTYELLVQKGLQLMLKPFAIGLRIEHPQDMINKAQYGDWAKHPRLGAAEYRLTFQHQPTGRGVYSFCMCPGGVVVGATSEINAVVTNGMSYQARNSGIANSAIIVTVGPKDFGYKSEKDSVLAGLDFQRKLEQKAFQLGGSDYSAPVQKLGDFFNKKLSKDFNQLKPTYLPGYTSANLWDLLPRDIGEAIADGIQFFGRKIKGFDWPEAVLTGVETRTSAPVRIMRDELREAVNIPGIYPVGEGAGYAGGIISSALDGWKTADAIIQKLSY
jgi:uncharacterized FAD-dependent dehydrogenase